MTKKDARIYIVQPIDSGKRLDIFLNERIPGISRSFAAILIRADHATVNNEAKKPGYRIKPDDEIAVHIPDAEPSAPAPAPIDIDILYEDNEILVLNKPAGLVVHPAPGHHDDTLVNGLLFHRPALSDVGGKDRAGIVHRLDRDTTGALVVAKTEAALSFLRDAFKQRHIEKKYIALVRGNPDSDSGTITIPIGRHPVHRKRISSITQKARDAVTEWIVLERFGIATLVDVNLKTGRTHQIRVHFSESGYPVVGDPVYGFGKRKNLPVELTGISRQMLHARSIRLTHPRTGKPLLVEAPMPMDMVECLRKIRKKTERVP